MYTDFPSIVAGAYNAELVHIAPNASQHDRRITFHFRLEDEEKHPAFLTVNSSTGKKSKLRKLVDSFLPVGVEVDKEDIFKSKESVDRFLHGLIGEKYFCTVLLGDQGFLKVDGFFHLSLGEEANQ